MTFDEGILNIYSMGNIADKGEKPRYMLSLKSQHYYGYDTLGINRYYTALQANQQIEAVVNIPEWHDININDICTLENGFQYQIRMIQPGFDDNNLKFTKLSLERLGENYDIRA